MRFRNTAIRLILISLFTVTLSASALAASDPPGCTSTGVTLTLQAFRADHTTPIGAGTVTAGETIAFQAELKYAGTPACNYANGTLKIQTPDGTTTDVTPGGGIPLITNTTPFDSSFVNYVVTTANVSGGFLIASTTYANGTSLLGSGISPVGATTPTFVLFQPQNVNVTKTAATFVDLKYNWTINKNVDPDTWWLFAGDTGTSQYNVSVNKTLASGGYRVNGTITITNPSEFAVATVTGVNDALTGPIAATVNCGVTFPHDIPAGGTLICTYNATVPDNTTRTNNATVTTSGDIGGGSGTAIADFANATTSVSLDSITVDDTNGASWNFSSSGNQVYTRQFDCSEVNFVNGQANYTHVNTATIEQTGQNSSASVAVHCYQLNVVKDAHTTFNRMYNWSIQKQANDTQLSLLVGQAANITYTVTAQVTGSVDNGWMVNGTINISNPNPQRAANLTGVIDQISPAINATVNCSTLIVPASGSIQCTYGPTALPDGSNRTNTATATQQNYDFASDGDATPSGTTQYSGTAPVNFGAPTNVVDAVINVTDTYAGFLGNVSVGQSPKQFTYQRAVGNYSSGQCGNTTINNTATYVALDTLTTGNASVSVPVTVVCNLGCTLTQGYWKTHSLSGPAGPYDSTWQKVGPAQENTTFFLSGQTWLQVFNTAPKGNAYYNLADQYMGAKLNIYANASTTPAVDSAINQSETLFSTYTPAQVGAWKGNQGQRQLFISLAGTLGDYNTGLIGPGHCAS